MISYFFAYQASLIGGGIAFGNRHLGLASPITSYEDIKMVAEHIRTLDPDCRTVVILSWQRFEEPSQ